jgi:hypothetical protein
MLAVCEGYGPVQTRPYGCGSDYLMKGRVFALISNGSEPGMLAVFEGYGPAQTRPYGCGNNYLRKGRVFTLISNGSEPGRVAVLEGYMPARISVLGFDTTCKKRRSTQPADAVKLPALTARFSYSEFTLIGV